MSRLFTAVFSVLCLGVFSVSVAFAAPVSHPLRIGYTHFAPFVFVHDNGELSGIDVELARAACRRLGCTPQFISVNWHQKETLLDEGVVDCIWTVFSIDGRETRYQWTVPYLRSRQVVIVPKSSPVRRLNDLMGLRVATTHDSQAENLLLNQQRLSFPVEIYSFALIDEAFACLAENYADAAASHEAALDYFSRHSNRPWRLLPESLAVVNVGVAFSRQTAPDTVQRLSRVLQDLRQDGTLPAILKKYDYTEPDDRTF